MRFEAPWVFLLVLCIPAVLLYRSKVINSGSLRFSSTAHAKKVKPSLRRRLAGLPLVLRILTLLVLISALARPQEGKEQVREISKGVAIEMVVDRSGSMGAEMDFEGMNLTRLDVVKRVFGEFVSGKGNLPGRPNDLIGMITFARYSDTICPLTLAHGALSQFLENVTLVTRRNEDGTGIGDALALAAARLKTAEETLSRQTKNSKKQFEIKSKIIILLTDGQNNAGKRSPLEAAELAKQWGIKIYVIGVGGREGMVRRQGLFGNFLFRMGGGVDKRTLSTIAKTTGGIFRMAEDARTLREVYEEIDRMERSEIESLRYMDYRELFQPLVFLIMLLLATEVGLSCTVFRRIP